MATTKKAGESKSSTKPKAKPKAAKKPRAARAKAAPAKQPRTEADEPTGAVLERGDLFFFYRPDVDDEAPSGLLDVRRFHLALRPEGEDRVRLITIGRKMLPGSGAEGGNHWAFVDRVFAEPEGLKEFLAESTYETESRGDRHLPAARPAGEGVYALARHAQGTVLAYALELPEEPGEVQRAFGIESEGRFVVSLKNPGADSPPGLGLDADRRVELPSDLARKFGARKWLPADPAAFLDHEGLEMVLIGGRVEPEDDLGLELDPQPEDEEAAEMFRDLHLDRSDRTIRPLFEGEWA